MLGTEEIKNLVYKINSDALYHQIEDPLKRMQYLINHRGRQIEHIGSSLLQACAHYERSHLKSLSTALAYLDTAHRHFENDNYEDYVKNVNSAIRYFPLEWNNWSVMSQLLDIYHKRALYYLSKKHYDEGYIDLKHCSSILYNIKDVDGMIQYFRDDPSILASMLTQKVHLIDCVKIETTSWANDLAKSFGDSPLAQSVIGLQRPCIEGMQEQLKQINITTLIQWMERVDNVFAKYEEKKSASRNPDFKLQINDKIKLDFMGNGGRCYRAKEHIVMGELIIQETPQSVILFLDSLLERCTNCTRSVSNFWPCNRCSEVVFCSYDCATTALETFHKYECGITGFILGKENFYSLAHVFRIYSSYSIPMLTYCENEILDRTEASARVSDFEGTFIRQELRRTEPLHALTDQEKLTLFRALTSLLHHRGKRDYLRESSTTILSFSIIFFLLHRGLLKEEILSDVDTLCRLAEQLSCAMFRTCTNGFCWTEDRNCHKVGSCICFVSSFFNHSCDPNVQWQINDTGITLRAIRAVKPGELMTICYGPKKDFDFLSRQSRLHDDYCFFCQCTVCRKDAAKYNIALKCNETANCPGPVLLNKYESCLTCGKKAEPEAYQLSKKVEYYSNQLLFTIGSMIQKKRISAKHLLLSCIGYRKKKATEQGGDHGTLKCQYPSLKSSKIKLEKLEKYFKRFSDGVFGRSYHLFDKCALMLYVYNQFGVDSKGLNLVPVINECLDEIFPELVDTDLISILYKLDFICKFFDNISSLSKSANHHHHYRFVCSHKLQTLSLSEFWSFQQKLNLKLYEILHYDIHSAGKFFPTLHAQLAHEEDDQLDAWIASGDDADIPEELPSKEEASGSKKLSVDEKYFKKLYEDCQRRMTLIDAVLNHESMSL